MNKKIGLITFHDTANYGAALQAYATINIISKLGFNVEIINYSNRFRSSLYEIFNKIKYDFSEKKYKEFLKTTIASPLIIKRMNIFNEFYSEFTPRSNYTYSEHSDLSSIEDMYEKIIIGSDQVWSTKNNGNDGFYYLDFVKDKKKTVSYASSFGSTIFQDDSIKCFSKSLSEISKISVREKTGQAIFENLTGRVPKVVLDPVFLLNESDWIKIIEKKYENIQKKEAFFVDYTSNKSYLQRFFNIPGTNKYASNFYKFGTSVSLSDVINKSVNLKFASDPIDFLYFIYNSALLFTSSFHGVVLSIIFKKKFLVILSGNPGRDSRIKDLLDSLGLSDRIFKDSLSLPDIENDIDYDSVHEKLAILREESINYLKSSLK